MGEIRTKDSAARLREERLSLPFDKYQRYRVVADALAELREDGETLRVLDVGCGEGIILRFLPGDDVTVLNQTEVEEVSDFVRGDATALPFEDDDFDYVVSVDTYEHIAAERRGAHLSELRRTARKGVLLAATFDSEAVRGAEKAANEFHRAIHGAANVWLSEHTENGLPDLDEARGFFEGWGDEVAIVPNGYLPHWLAMICLTFQRARLEDGLAGALDAVNAFYNESLYPHDNAEPCYRYLLLCLKDSKSRDGATPFNLDGLISTKPGTGHPSSGLALFGALPVALPMAAEVERLNRHLTQTTGTLARKEAQVTDLSRRIAELVGAENARQARMEKRLNEAQRLNEGLKKSNEMLKKANEKLKEANEKLKEASENSDKISEGLRRQIADIQGSRTWRLLSSWRTLGNLLGRGRRGSG